VNFDRLRRSGLLQIHLAVLLFGFAGLFGKFIQIDPAAITFGRSFFAGITLLIGVSLGKKSLALHSRKDLGTLFIAGMVLGFHWYTFFLSIQVSSVAIGLLTFSTFPIFVTFMEPIFFREKLKKFDVVVAIFVVLGLALVIPSFDLTNNVTQGVFWGVLSGFTFAILSLLNRMHVSKYPPLTIAFYQLCFATLFNLPGVIFSQVMPSTRDILLLIALGVLCTALAQLLYISSLKQIKAQLASIIASLEPVYGIILAFFLLGELPTLRILSGGLLIIGAVFAAMNRPTNLEKI
jgi:drug/metabolite transporter (DMT)-like permease